MTYTEAMEVRLRSAQRQPVDPEELELANRVVKATRSLMLEHDIPEPEPVKTEAPPKPAFPEKRILVHPAEPLPKVFAEVLKPRPRDAGDDEQVELLWAALKPAKAPAPPKPAREITDRPRPKRDPWQQATAMVLAHDRTSVSLGQLHKVPVQVMDFYP